MNLETKDTLIKKLFNPYKWSKKISRLFNVDYANGQNENAKANFGILVSGETGTLIRYNYGTIYYVGGKGENEQYYPTIVVSNENLGEIISKGKKVNVEINTGKIRTSNADVNIWSGNLGRVTVNNGKINLHSNINKYCALLGDTGNIRFFNKENEGIFISKEGNKFSIFSSLRGKEYNISIDMISFRLFITNTYVENNSKIESGRPLFIGPFIITRKDDEIIINFSDYLHTQKLIANKNVVKIGDTTGIK